MAIAFSEDDKSKVKFAAIKAFYPLSFQKTINNAGFNEISLSNELRIEGTISEEKCAFVLNADLIELSSDNIAGTVVVGKWKFNHGSDPDTSYPVIHIYTSAQGRAQFRGSFIIFE